jgi:hypothetical protein
MRDAEKTGAPISSAHMDSCLIAGNEHRTH